MQISKLSLALVTLFTILPSSVLGQEGESQQKKQAATTTQIAQSSDYPSDFTSYSDFDSYAISSDASENYPELELVERNQKTKKTTKSKGKGTKQSKVQKTGNEGSSSGWGSASKPSTLRKPSKNAANGAGVAGSVGPLTSLSEKSNICDITKYGAVAGNKTDISTAITNAFNECVLKTSGSTLRIPEGNWLLTKPVVLNGGTKWAFQIQGLITCAYSTSAWSASTYNTAIVIKNANDFEMYSDNGLGAIQGNGYVYRINSGEQHDQGWMRLVRIVTSTNVSVHDLILVDSPMYFLVVYLCSNVEVYYITIRGGNTGMTDGIDISGYNYFVHDVEVTNKDECVCVKSPSTNAEISNIYCSSSGGVSIGSLQSGANVTNIKISDVYNYNTNSLMFIKTKPGGSGFVKNCEFSNFYGYDCAFGIDIDQYWDSKSGSGGVQLENLVFSGFYGSIAAAYAGRSPTRGGVKIIGAYDAPPVDITLEDIVMYKNEGRTGQYIDVYQDAYGEGYQLKPDSASASSYTTSITATAAPSGWTQPALPKWNVGSTGYGLTVSIPVYTPAVMWS
ncbi:unnamed protein product [Ambrosiozyma monospora]|uniref:Unnamed protein product n=1 Tax=Ambrosiozyma monospora TaxID=43982 RepID=A0A9W6YT56_AMBMO|nr:unnamed protein product [Ambrosiozyma monospora]